MHSPPVSQRNLIVNLIHHGDHPSVKETIKRTAKDYYWPRMRADITEFCRTCHPCQVAKQSATVKPGIGHFPVPDERFSYIHVDIVGPLPESKGHRYLLSVLDRTSRWLELYPMRTASASECCEAFIQWLARFGCPSTVVSDNGNSFVSRLWEDITKTFGIEVRYTPAYHAATNGAVERAHQTFKNGLKAALVAMGDEHREHWMSALPWVLLGKRVQFQPHLDASSSQLVLGKSVKVPGQLLGQPGPPLNTSQTRALLDQLYVLAARPPVETSAPVIENNIDNTLRATHVYVKRANPLSLESKFEGPFRIISRPSRSQIQVRIGSFANGSDRLLTFHWSSCKIANRRSGAQDGQRPRLGRPSNSGQVSPKATSLKPSSTQTNKVVKPVSSVPNNQNQPVPSVPNNQTRPKTKVNNKTRGKIQTADQEYDPREPLPDHIVSPDWSPRPGPSNCNFGPVITKDMLDRWGEVVPRDNPRPARSTRNSNPHYVD